MKSLFLLSRSICFRRSIAKMTTDRSKIKIAVAMSGGIDSSAVAMILKDQGYDCIGVFMKNWDTDDEEGRETCPLDQDRNDMLEVCDRLQIPSTEVEFVKEYWNDVFIPFLKSYESGIETPNPDVRCNRFIKFDKFREYAFNKLKVDYIATGHYVRTRLNNETNKVELLTGIDHLKDQSYFLSMTQVSEFLKLSTIHSF